MNFIPALFLRGIIVPLVILFPIISHAQIPAFPGALGFGASVTGGRGGTVYHVTTLADSGSGSFRDAVSHSHRIIIFDVGGYIKLNSAVSCAGDLTIAGQTAPGGGIGFYGGEISFSSRSNLICRYVRIRPGSFTSSDTDDALALANARTMIFDHCSFEFGPWNNVDAVSGDWQNTPVTEITFQNCLDADPTYQQFGAHTESVNSTMTWVYSIFANSHNRNPLAKINTVFVNNVDYNCSAGYTTHTSTSFNHDIINNYFVAGPASGGDFPWYQIDNNQSMYFSGNLYDANKNSSLDGSVTAPLPGYQGGGTVLASPWSPVTATIPTYNAATAFRLCISQAGAFPRDQMDNLVVSQIKNLGNGTTGTGAGTAGPDGSLYSDQTQTGLGNSGYGIINGAIGPTDSDGDGMPDYWENAVGLNSVSAGDATTIASDGYANIEHYVNWLGSLHSLTSTNTAVNVDLWQFTSGFTNASPTYSLNNASNGVVTLDSSHIVHFTPDLNFSGLGSFQFTVTTTDGSYTNIVNVLVTPQSFSTGPGANLIWVGDGISNTWDAGGATNWFDGTNYVAFTAGDTVTFDDTGFNSPAINLSGALSATAINVIADSQDYTFSGSGILSGISTLYKVGGGNLFVNTINTFSGGVTIAEGTVQLGDGVSANGSLAGNITNNDTLIYANPATLSSSVNISGSGVLIKNAAGSLTLSGTQTYTNSTTINSGSLQFSGSIPSGDIVDNGTLILAPSGSTTLNNFISGSGNVSVNASGTTTLSAQNAYSGGTTNSGGTLNIANDSAVGAGPVTYLSGAVHIADETVITNTFVVPSSTADSMLDLVSGTATWAGDIVLTGGGAQFRPSGINGTLYLTGHGNFGNRNFIIPRGSVHIAGNADFSATGSASSFDRNSTGNSGFFTVEDNASVSFAQFSLGGGQASGGRMILTINDNANFTVTANFDLHNSTASSAVSSINLNGGTLTVGGFIKTRTGSSQLSTNFFNGGTLKAYAANSSFLPALSGFKAVVQSGGAIVDDSGFPITIAAPLTHDPAFGTADGGLIKLGPGTLTLGGASTYLGNTVVSNGTLALAASGSIANSTNIIVAGGIFDISAAGGFTLGSGKTISGFGTINGNFSVSSGATLSPGLSIGTLTFNNALSMAAGSTNIFEINHSPLTNDIVNVGGTLALNGTLIVTNTGNSSVAAGDSFKLFNASGVSGSFTKVLLPALDNPNLRWDTNALNTSGIISVVSIASPAPPVFNVSSPANGEVVFSGAGGGTNATFYLLGSTNVSMPVSNWTRLLTNQFDGNGNFNFTNPADPNTPQYFYLLQEP
ncbi:MAG TPA: autotransporter-associated beta strand repeat-containing protein [Verrucomicrobiae bacterium]|nr:autotransporter-associated beta strand repeat-containing protein [Verrucomicrobiae bacterium]